MAIDIFSPSKITGGKTTRSDKGTTRDWSSARTFEDLYEGGQVYTGSKSAGDLFREKHLSGLQSGITTAAPTFGGPGATRTLESLLGPDAGEDFWKGRISMTPGTITPEVQNVMAALGGMSDEALGEQLAQTRSKYFRAADTAGQLGFEETFRRNRLERDAAIANIIEGIRQEDIDRQFQAAEGLAGRREQDIGLLDRLAGEETTSDISTEETTSEQEQQEQWIQQQVDSINRVYRDVNEVGFDFTDADNQITQLTSGMTKHEVNWLSIAAAAQGIFKNVDWGTALIPLSPFERQHDPVEAVHPLNAFFSFNLDPTLLGNLAQVGDADMPWQEKLRIAIIQQARSPIIGGIDLRTNPDTWGAQANSAQATPNLHGIPAPEPNENYDSPLIGGLGESIYLD
jgi:hypothetical protein